MTKLNTFNLRELVFNAKLETFRLELLEQYKVNGEWEQFQKYLNGEEVKGDEYFKEFCQFISKAVKKGIKHRRVHVVPQILTPYLKFEIENGYFPMSEAGASIFLIEKPKYFNLLYQLFQEKFQPHEFWLIDDKIVIELKYHQEGILKETKLITEKKLVQNYVKLKENLLQESIDFRKWPY